MARKKKRHSAPADLWKLILAIVVFAVSLSGIGVGAYLRMTAPSPAKRDQQTMCPIDRAPSQITAVLLDTSDALSEVTKQQIFKELTDVFDKLPDGALVQIDRLEPSVTVKSKTVAVVCNPGDGSGISELNGNPELARKRWKERYSEPLRTSLAESLEPTPGQFSPILGAIQKIANGPFYGAAVEAIPKRLIIVSDMLENTPDYSQYGNKDFRYQRFKQSLAYKKYWTDLKDAAVQIYYVQRPKFTQSGEHILFWEQWANDNKGRLEPPPKKLQGL